MKSIFVYFTAMFSCFTLFAFSNQGRLSVSAADNSMLRIIIDDRFERQGSYIAINDLPFGHHNVKIFHAENDRRSNRTSNNFRLIYSSHILVKPSFSTEIVINRFGKVLIDEKQLGTFNNNNDRDWRNGNDSRSRDWGNDRDIRDRDYRDDRDNRDRDYRPNDNYSNRFGQPMSDNMFYSAKQIILRENFDRAKMIAATRLLENNYVSARQVKEITLILPGESNKLDFARNAYARTVDRQNYFVIFDCFTFNSSKEALSDYIRNNR